MVSMLNMNTLADRLKHALGLANAKQIDLARACGITKSAVNHWFTGSVTSIEGENLMRAATFLGVSPMWLATGTGKMAIEKSETEQIPGITIQSRRRHYPVISYVQAGAWREIVDNFEPGDAESYRLADNRYGQHTFGLVITGNSMEPEFKAGDVVFIDPDVVPNPGDYVVARNSEEEATFKKYRPRGMNEHGVPVFELVPLNEDYATMRSDHQPIQIIGTMVEHTRYRRG